VRILLFLAALVVFNIWTLNDFQIDS